jgi:hypothetical protein
MNKPNFLFHGSQAKVTVLLPNQAYDGLSDVGTANGVFATSNRELALIFALGCIPDEQGRITRFVQSIDPIQVIFLEGKPNRGGKGYLYTLDCNKFEQLDDFQWVSYEEVTPLQTEEIIVNEYLHLVKEVTEQEKIDLLKLFNQDQRK